MFFSGRDEEGRPTNPLAGLLVALLAPLAASLIQMAISRAREFEADRGGAEISGDPRALASALERIHAYASGIPLAAAVAIELARLGHNKRFAYNRKEAKDHGEGGTLVGAPLQGRVLIIDDVMSAGTAARESIALIKAAGATPHAVAIALDRQEMATELGADGQTRDVPYSAVQYVRNQLGLQVCAIAQLNDLLGYLGTQGAHMNEHHARVQAYRQRYGVA